MAQKQDERDKKLLRKQLEEELRLDHQANLDSLRTSMLKVDTNMGLRCSHMMFLS